MVRTKTKEQIELIGRSGKIMAEIFQKIPSQLNPGVTTSQIDKWIEKFIRDKGGKPVFKGYRGYPKCTCIS
ncbi:M24 family metallopeptidase, partial [Patescibacteria group bacterium]|nr:M24 family metallopeptidase [Patescibacteria group bacterium]